MDKILELKKASLWTKGWIALIVILLLAAGIHYKGAELAVPHLTMFQQWLLMGVIALSVLVWIVWRCIVSCVAQVSRFVLWLVYRPRIIDRDNVPKEGGVLLVCNHVSVLDSFLIYTQCGRPVRFVAQSSVVPKGFPDYITTRAGAIPISPGDRCSVITMLKKGREALRNGEIVCVFAEGDVSKTGQLKPFNDSFISLLKGQGNIPVIPVFIGGLWNSIFSGGHSPERCRWWPSRLLRRVTVAFGKPIHRPKNAWEVHQALQELGVDAMNPARFPKDRQLMALPRQVIRSCRKYPRAMRIADSTGIRLNGRQALLRILILRRVLHRILSQEEKFLGLLLPTAVGGTLANVACTFDHRIPINLNYTFNNETSNYCIHKVGIKKVLTSKKLLQKLPDLQLDAELLLIEDLLKTSVTKSDKILGLLESLLPTFLLERLLGLTKIKPSDLNTVVFTSGSTGLPKGVMLSQDNVAANVHTFLQLLPFTTKDRLLGVLPLFHSFGYTTGVWAIMTSGVSCFYHYSPLEARLIGEYAQKEGTTIMTTTPTFMRNYIRRCPPEAFSKMTAVIPGAEKLSPELAEAWYEKYGHRPSEGFGMTELSPVLAANIPDYLLPDQNTVYRKQGSIGRTCAGFAVRIVHPDTGAVLSVNQEGMMEIKGPCVMQGYYGEPEKTAATFHDGWFVSGDIAKIDEDGFIFITGRRTRMSKIGGEMVPHVLIEEKISEILTNFDRNNHVSADKILSAKEQPAGEEAEESLRLAVTAVPDDKKGEKIVVLYTDLPMTPEEICRKLLDEEMPQIWVPAPINFKQVNEIPVLRTGKLDLCRIKNQALQLYGLDA